MECWGGTDGLRSAGNLLAGSVPSSSNFAIWWDGDLLRELLDHTYISKYGGGTLLEAEGCVSINGTKGNPNLQADILGDWREEVIWGTSDYSHLRIYTTTDLTTYRLKTLMHDHVYRLGIAWQNVAYNQPPHTGFYLGHGMTIPTSQVTPSMPQHPGISIAPNPLSDQTLISISISHPSEVSIELYNALGQKVKTLVNKIKRAEPIEIQWNRDDDSGRRVNSGLYFCRIMIDQQQVAVRKILIPH
jgi:hypothetical protein